jgi:sugar phosphate permease
MTDMTLAMAADIQTPEEDALYRKVIFRIVPLFFLGFIVSYLDRVNIGFAKLQMTPHMSGWTDGMVARRRQTIATNIEMIAAGQTLINIVRGAQA